MTQGFKVALVGLESMNRHQSDPTLSTWSTRPLPPYADKEDRYTQTDKNTDCKVDIRTRRARNKDSKVDQYIGGLMARQEM